MDPLIIPATSECPAINFNAETGLFSISGKSYPENANEVYKPVFDFLELYKKDPREKTILEFNWTYFNTSTFKIIIKLIRSLKEVKAPGKVAEVNWRCKKSDELMIELGEEIKEVMETDFNIIYV
jgi:hypothetical protein